MVSFEDHTDRFWFRKKPVRGYICKKKFFFKETYFFGWNIAGRRHRILKVQSCAELFQSKSTEVNGQSDSVLGLHCQKASPCPGLSFDLSGLLYTYLLGGKLSTVGFVSSSSFHKSN